MKTMTHQEWKDEAVRRFGSNPMDWRWVCVRCGNIQGIPDFLSCGMTKEEALKYVGFSCIGIWDNTKGCDWTLGGLFRIHQLEVITEDGEHHPQFEFAEKGGD